MALILARLHPISSCISSLSNGLYTRNVRSYYVYKDPQYKNIPVSKRFRQKHYKPEFRKDRAMKFMQVDLPKLEDPPSIRDLTPTEIRAKFKEKGIQPPRTWMEKPIFVASTSDILEPYIPPEGDGKVSFASKKGAVQRLRFIEKKGKTMVAIRKVRQYDEDFDTTDFAEQAQKIYIDTHKALADFDKDKLYQLVTEHAYPLVTHERKNRTMRWQFIRSLEPPQVVHARTGSIITKENIFAQVTVRFHTKQTLAIYDRFGRLIYGSEVVARDVLEYVVFEKHIANTYGIWRIHDKIIPDWMPPRQPIRKTFVAEVEDVEETPAEESEKEVAVSANS